MTGPGQRDIVSDAHTAADLIAKALRHSGYVADFSAQSAWELDRFFDEQMIEMGTPKPKGLLSENQGARLFAIGSYLGEVIRRNAQGWAWEPGEGAPEDEIKLTLRRGSELIWPVQRAIKRFTEGAENGIAVYASALGGVEVGPRPEAPPPMPKRRWFGLRR